MIVLSTHSFDNLRHSKMLNDFIISRDVIAFVANYLSVTQIELPNYQQKLESFQQKQHMSYEQWWALLNELDELVEQPALGVEIGKHITAEQSGLLGYLYKTSHNMAEALSCYSRFERLLYAGGHVETIQNKADELTLAWNPEHGYSSLISDALLVSGLVSVARGILQPKVFKPVQVSFTHGIKSADLKYYQDYFGCPVHSGQERLSITFTTEDLLYPIPHQDSVLHSLLGQQAQDQLSQMPESDLFLVSLHDTIIRSLHEGRPDAESIAKHLNISSRTLHRRLKTKDRIYRDVLKDVRKSMAERYLKDPKLSLSEVALLLGYQDQSAFTRAFSSWFDCSPKQYRQKQIATE